MYRIDNSTAAGALPMPGPTGPNPNGFFTGGNPASNTPATVLDPDWANAVQEEICGVVTAAGETLSKANHAQLLQAIFALPAKNSFVFPSSGTFTPPAGVTRLRVRAWGGGAAGAGSSSTSFCGGGGGGGGYCEGIFTVTPGTVIPVTVGAGGTSGASGSASSFGSYCTANGGAAGTAGTSSVGGNGGNGGTATGGSVNIAGQTGGNATQLSATITNAGQGGGTYGTPSSLYGVAAVGTATGGPVGSFPGGGGAGANGGTPGSGGAGLVIVEW